MSEQVFTTASPRRASQIVWWRRVDDPAEAEWLRTTSPRGSRNFVPACGRCHKSVGWSERFHAHVCLNCDRWLSPVCATRCEDCAARPARPSEGVAARQSRSRGRERRRAR